MLEDGVGALCHGSAVTYRMRNMLECGKSWIVDFKLDPRTQSLHDRIRTDPEYILVKFRASGNEIGTN